MSRKPRLEIVKGTLDVLILKSLNWGRMHGYAVARWIREASDEDLQIEEGALYPALHRLEQKGLLESEWGLSESNRRAKYYRLTDAGLRRLRSETATWQRFVQAMAKILSATEQPTWVEP